MNMKVLLRNHGRQLQCLSLVGMLTIPFLLYIAAMKDAMIILVILLALMALTMLVAVFYG